MGQAVERRHEIGKLAGEVDAAQRVGEGGQPRPLIGLERVTDQRDALVQHASEQLTHAPLGEACGERIDGHDTTGMQGVTAGRAEVRGGELRPPSAEGDLAAHHDLVSGVQPALNESAAEPDRLRAPGIVRELGNDPLRTPSEARLDAHIGHADPR